VKLAGAQAAAFCRSPDQALAGALLHGADEAAVAASRRELVAALLGGHADPMQIENLDPGTVRRDPAALDAALRARGFFGGRGVVLVEKAADAHAGPIETVLPSDRTDSFLVVTAGLLATKSSLRRLFEGSKSLISLQIIPERPGQQAIASRLSRAGVSAGLSDGARDMLVSLAAEMDPAAFDRFLETLATYALSANRPLEIHEVAALAPSGLEGELEAFIAAVAGGRADTIGPLLRRLNASGATPVTLLIGLQRHFRHLLIAACAEGGPEAGLGRIRPPLWRPKRDSMRAQLGAWQRDRLEAAARLLFEADGRVRSAERVPALALVERCALRLALMAGR
jgi:DNA polymerase III subunit delta